MLRVHSTYVRRRGSTGLTSACETWPTLVMIGESTRGVTILIFGAMQEHVVGLSADPSPVHLDAGLVGFPHVGRGLAPRRLVPSRPVEAEQTSLDLHDDSSPFLRSFRSEYIAGGEAVLVPDLSLGILGRVVVCTGRALGGR